MIDTTKKVIEDEIDTDFQTLLDHIGVLRGAPAARLALRMAARLVEMAAFESAQVKGSATISRLILMAADLERIASGDDTGTTRRH